MQQVEIEKTATLTGHKGAVYKLVADPKNKRCFYSASGDGLVIKWNLDNTQKAEVVAKVDANVFSLALIDDQFVLGQMSGNIHVLDLNQKKEVRNLQYHQKGVFDLQLLEEEQELWAAGGDGKLTIWNAIDFTLKKSLDISKESIRNLSFHPSDPFVAVACSDNQIYILDRSTLKIENQLTHHKNSVFTTCFSTDGKQLFAGSRDAFLSQWNTDDFQLQKSVPGHLFTINDLKISSKNNLLFSASRDKTIRIWKADSLNLLKVVSNEKQDSHVNSVNALLWLEEENLLISGSDDRSIIVWKINS